MSDSKVHLSLGENKKVKVNLENLLNYLKLRRVYLALILLQRSNLLNLTRHSLLIEPRDYKLLLVEGEFLTMKMFSKSRPKMATCNLEEESYAIKI